MADLLKDEQTGPLEGPGDSFAVECLPVVMRQIQAEVIEGFYSTPKGGVEVGGVLYGARKSGRIVIMLARTLGCEHASGPSFVLSTNEHARLAALLEAPQHDHNLAGMRVLGWYHSHTRSELELTPQDLELHDRYFPEPGQVALVLRPGTMRPMRTCFYYRGTDGVLQSYKPYPESETSARMAVPGSLDGPGLRGLLRDTEPHARMAAPRPLEVPPELPPTPRPPVVRESGARPAAEAPAPPVVRESSAQAAANAPALSDLPRFLAVEAPPRRRWTIWASVAVAACLLAGGAGYVIRTHWTRTGAVYVGLAPPGHRPEGRVEGPLGRHAAGRAGCPGRVARVSGRYDTLHLPVGPPDAPLGFAGLCSKLRYGGSPFDRGEARRL